MNHKEFTIRTASNIGEEIPISHLKSEFFEQPASVKNKDRWITACDFDKTLVSLSDHTPGDSWKGDSGLALTNKVLEGHHFFNELSLQKFQKNLVPLKHLLYLKETPVLSEAEKNSLFQKMEELTMLFKTKNIELLPCYADFQKILVELEEKVFLPAGLSKIPFFRFLKGQSIGNLRRSLRAIAPDIILNEPLIKTCEFFDMSGVKNKILTANEEHIVRTLVQYNPKLKSLWNTQKDILGSKLRVNRKGGQHVFSD